MAAIPMLEVCVESVEAGVEAASLGADRIELNSALALGGLTPSFGQFARLQDKVSVPIVVMIRPRAGGFCYSDDEFATMLSDAQLFLKQGAAGIVFGCLTEPNRLHRQQIETLVKTAGECETIFHRAFDTMLDPISSTMELIELGVTRILTSGSAVSAVTGMKCLAELQARFGSQIEILPAAGIRAANVGEILKRTRCSQIHGTFSNCEPDPGLPFPKSLEFVDFATLQNGQLRVINSNELADTIELLRRVDAS